MGQGIVGGTTGRTMPSFAANLSLMFPELAFLDRFGAAARAGFKAVEYLFPYAYPPDLLASRLSEAGLTQALFNLPPGDWDAGERGTAALPGREAEFRAGLDSALAYAKALRCRRLHAMAGIVPEGADPAECEAVYVRNLRFAATAAAAAGVAILIEPINTRDMPGYFLTRTAQARRVIEAVGADNLFLQYDLYHAQISEGFLSETLRANRDIIRHVQIAGVPGRHEPDDRQEINYPFLFALLDSLGYDGWVGCEYRPRGDTLDGLRWAVPYGVGGRSA
jgi:hydroxypyruvate isomerase